MFFLTFFNVLYYYLMPFFRIFILKEDSYCINLKLSNLGIVLL